MNKRERKERKEEERRMRETVNKLGDGKRKVKRMEVMLGYRKKRKEVKQEGRGEGRKLEENVNKKQE